MLLLKLFAQLLSPLPWRVGQWVGGFLGLIWYYGLPIRRKTVRSNLALALPERRDHRAIARACYRHLGISFYELLKASRLSNPELAKKIHPHGMSRYHRAIAKGRGVIVVTAHFGNFDLLAVSQAALGIPLAIVSRSLRQPGVNRLWMSTRKRSGVKIFPESGAARSILKWLQKGKVIGLTADQRTKPSKGGIQVDFLGHPAWTTTAPAALAMATGAPLLPVRLERRSDGDHDLFIEEEIPLTRPKNSQSVFSLVEKYNEVIGKWVATCPEQWMWLHKRFKDYKRIEQT